MNRKVVKIFVNDEVLAASFAGDSLRVVENELTVEETWPAGLKLVGVGYGWIKFEGNGRTQLTRPVTVNVPEKTEAIYVGITGMEMPTGTDQIKPARIGGILCNIVKNCNDDGTVIVSDGKFVFDARAVLLNGDPPGAWSMYLAVEIMCFAA
jgi:hypothetical protein